MVLGTIIKKTLIVIGTVVACALFINGYNYARLDIRNFDDGARDLLRRASTIRDLARRDYQARALSGMKPNVMNGTVLRLTDMLPHGQVREAPAQPESNMIVGRVGGFEFNQPGEAKLVAAKGYASGEVENGIFRARQRQADYLFNETPLDIPSSDIHEMQICAGTDKATRIIVGLTDLDNPKTRKSEVAEIEKFGIEIKLVGKPLLHLRHRLA